MPDYPSTSAAIEFVVSKLRANSALGGVPKFNDEESDTNPQGIMYFIASAGSNQGNTDGHRAVINPLVSVLCFGPDLAQLEQWNQQVQLSLEASFGSTPYGYVARFAQESPYHDSQRRPDKSVRHVIGGLYRATIVPLSS